MSFAILGTVLFQAISSPETFESKRGWTFAEHKTVESTPLLQWTGNELEEISLDISLHVAFANPTADLAALVAAGKSHSALPLVFGNGTHRGWFVITKLTETAKKLADDGTIIAVGVKLELKQWVRSVEIDPNAPAIPATLPPAIIVGPLAPGQTVAGVVSTSGTVKFSPATAGTSAVVSTSVGPPATTPLPDPDSISTAQICRMDSSAGSVLG